MELAERPRAGAQQHDAIAQRARIDATRRQGRERQIAVIALAALLVVDEHAAAIVDRDAHGACGAAPQLHVTRAQMHAARRNAHRFANDLQREARIAAAADLRAERECGG
jgi:hypothetical protein